MSEYAVEIREVEKGFNQFTLGTLNFCIPKGVIVGYIGQNGAGKSTTIKLILGLLKPDNGSIKVLGVENVNKSGIKDKIGVVFDDLFLPEEIRIKDVERLGKNIYSKWDSKSFEMYKQKFNLPEAQLVKTYSRGMKMKLSMAIALSHNAELLILDEATSGLDPVVREEILDILLEFMQLENHTILISSHILSDLEKVADYIAFIDNGKLLFMEEKDELKENYGIIAVSDEQLCEIDKKAIVGMRSHAFGKELLVKRNLIPESLKFTKPSIEDIMVYYLKGEKV